MAIVVRDDLPVQIKVLFQGSGIGFRISCLCRARCAAIDTSAREKHGNVAVCVEQSKVAGFMYELAQSIHV